METAAKPSTLRSILQQRCPRCRMGRIFRYSIFRGFPKMQERCAICDLKFEREPGYFLGAMYISYGLGVLIMAPISALLWALTGWWGTKGDASESPLDYAPKREEENSSPFFLEAKRDGHPLYM